LPKVSAAASSPELKKALDKHQALTSKHVSRLEEVFELCGVEPERNKCKGMAGLIAESESVLEAIIAATQRVEHYETAVYGSLRTYAQLLGDIESARLLPSTLDE